MNSLWFLLGGAYFLIVLMAVALIYVFVELRAMQKSTHQISYVNPFEQEMKKYEQMQEQDPQTFQELSEEDEKELKKDVFGNIM